MKKELSLYHPQVHLFLPFLASIRLVVLENFLSQFELWQITFFMCQLSEKKMEFRMLFIYLIVCNTTSSYLKTSDQEVLTFSNLCCSQVIFVNTLSETYYRFASKSTPQFGIFYSRKTPWHMNDLDGLLGLLSLSSPQKID